MAKLVDKELVARAVRLAEKRFQTMLKESDQWRELAALMSLLSEEERLEVFKQCPEEWFRRKGT